ncbi:MAG: glycosyltransferase family 4 protein [Candidatus Sumerlaeia bacterium]|nr:glycosyltransferase family 4 protein [Candidatus Sumerlaeia bacterium]
MKFLFVLYRFGRDITGGAEIHHRRLIDDLLLLGHKVEVWTTTGKEIPPVGHWGVDWQSGYPEGTEVEKETGLVIRRFGMDRVPRLILALTAKHVEHKLDELKYHPELLAKLHAVEYTTERKAPFLDLWTGWHHPENSPEGPARWSGSTARFMLGHDGEAETLVLEGSTPEPKQLHLQLAPGLLLKKTVSGMFKWEVPLKELAPGIHEVTLSTSGTKPLRDHRVLGFYLKSAELLNKKGVPVCNANIGEDVRSIGRRHFHEWIPLLEERASRISQQTCGWFDWLRGPRSSALKNALRNVPEDVDLVVACNFPWSVIPLVAEQCKRPWAAMALWHLEDDYYHWPHYTAALRKAAFVLANTPFSEREFFTPRGITARFVGPGIPPLKKPASSPSPKTGTLYSTKETKPGFRMLTVSRKSGEKRYQLIVEAVELLREQQPQLNATLTFIGPDGDGAPLPPWVDYRGRVDDEALAEAYAESDVFLLLSDSESFGMVVAEAWLHGKPVIVNRHCGPVASLVDEGENGFAVGTVEECCARLKELAADADLRQRLGAAGKLKTEREYLQRAATLRFLKAAEEFTPATISVPQSPTR